MTKPLSIFRSNWQLYCTRKHKLMSAVVFLWLWHGTQLKTFKLDKLTLAQVQLLKRSSSQGQQLLWERVAIIFFKCLFLSSKDFMSSKFLKHQRKNIFAMQQPSAVSVQNRQCCICIFLIFSAMFMYSLSVLACRRNYLQITYIKPELGTLICKVYLTLNTTMLLNHHITHPHICYTWHPPRLRAHPLAVKQYTRHTFTHKRTITAMIKSPIVGSHYNIKIYETFWHVTI